jgi:predicted Ser/Thr protein kinase
VAPLNFGGTADILLEGMARRWESLDATDMVEGSTDDQPHVERTAHDILSRSSPFSMLSAGALAELLSVMQPREFQPGDYLIRQGDPGEFLLLILSGRAYARAHDAPDDQPPLGEFGPGDVVGEMSLVIDETRTADVVARGFVRVLLLSASDFSQLADRHPDLRVVLTEIVADRLGNAAYDGLGGKDIHGYHVVQCVGRGGMGVVYEAAQLATGRTVALKMMNHRFTYDLDARRRFRREATILESLDHPSIARLYECFSAYKTEFLAMEFCQGQTLGQTIAMRGPLPEELVRRVLGHLALALNYIHRHGVVHRDLKPSNIVLTRAGAIKLLDFGIVTVERGSELWPRLKTTSRAGFIGTPRYMAPELFSDRVADYRADLYGLACVAFEALTGRSAIAASTMFDVMREHANFVLPPRDAIGTGVSEEMYDVLVRGFDHDPDKRLVDLKQLALWAGSLNSEEQSATGTSIQEM